MNKHSTSSVMRWLFAHLLPYKARVVIALVALSIAAASWLVMGQGVKLVVDEGFMADNAARLDQVMLVVLAIAVAGSVAAFFRFYLMLWLGERVSADIRNEVYAHLLSLSPAFFSQTRTGEVISRFTSDTTVLQTVIGMGMSMALRSIIGFIGALVLMLITSPLLTLYVLLAVPVVMIPIRVLGPRVRRYSRLSQDTVANMGAYVDESLHEIQTVQAYTQETISRQSFANLVDKVMEAAEQRIGYRALLIAVVMAFSISAIVVVAWLGARSVLDGGISAGELAAFMFYAVMAGGSVATISEVLGEIQKAAGASERMMELLDTPTQISSTSSQQVDITQHSLTLQNVTFTYPGSGEKAVLQDVNIDIAQGQRVALVGPSGAGKSTLFQLLLRFYDIQQGAIILGQHDLKTMPLKQLRQQFALVSQEPVIFASSVLENIAYGRPDASKEDIKQAAKAAYADDFIGKLPDGYDTNLGERGVRLSGGQKQRISIARAILSKRPILLLDEATSALDARSEREVKLALDELMKDKTTLIIAHRLSTVVNADSIVVMDEGKVIAQGTHAQLLNESPLYKQFAELQLVS
ncbi:ABC transporter transmembrane domain-containing protein [Aestuariibacter salexigens]|uniref:ABC transporter transmembrane domain-containing protein n=1 Tax=Aestuariibacter salexigens TaxID=226010 RepID=UPI000419410C|nr:ABC transporter transmembrane domain-containing protein [Aestuariibacter salexigens]